MESKVSWAVYVVTDTKTQRFGPIHTSRMQADIEAESTARQAYTLGMDAEVQIRERGQVVDTITVNRHDPRFTW